MVVSAAEASLLPQSVDLISRSPCTATSSLSLKEQRQPQHWRFTFSSSRYSSSVSSLSTYFPYFSNFSSASSSSSIDNAASHRKIFIGGAEVPVSVFRSFSKIRCLKDAFLKHHHGTSVDCTPPERSGDLLASKLDKARCSSSDGGFIRSKLAVFLSGGGSNFRALHSATLSNSIYGDVAVVVSDKPGCKGCEYARENDIPVLSFPLSKHAQDSLSAPDLVAALRDYGTDYVLLAGYLKLLPAELVQAYSRSILNIHPSLLPSFGGKGYYGMKVHEAVIKSGARYSGATIHFVDENFDTGPILAQKVVPVLSHDTPQDLAARVLKVEHILYSEAVAALCEDRIFWREDGVPLIRKSWDEAEYY